MFTQRRVQGSYTAMALPTNTIKLDKHRETIQDYKLKPNPELITGFRCFSISFLFLLFFFCCFLLSSFPLCSYFKDDTMVMELGLCSFGNVYGII